MYDGCEASFPTVVVWGALYTLYITVYGCSFGFTVYVKFCNCATMACSAVMSNFPTNFEIGISRVAFRAFWCTSWRCDAGSPLNYLTVKSEYFCFGKN